MEQIRYLPLQLFRGNGSRPPAVPVRDPGSIIDAPNAGYARHWFCQAILLAGFIALAVFANGLLLSCPAMAGEGDVVAVYLRDGRVLKGVVDEKTNDVELWLHSAEPSILLLTSVPWSAVGSARAGEKEFSSDAFRTDALQSKSPLPIAVFRQPTIAPAPIARVAHRVESLDVFAQLANWDADAATDGIELHVYPLAADSNTIPIDGWLTVRLRARRRGTRDIRTTPPQFGFFTNGAPLTEYVPLHFEERYVELGRWTERIEAKHFTLHGHVTRLPYRTIHPEHDLDIDLDGLLECRLSVNGQGIVSATGPVQLRPFSPLRDTLQLERGTRFFPDE